MFRAYPAHLQEVHFATVYMRSLVSSLSAGDCLVHRLRKNCSLSPVGFRSPDRPTEEAQPLYRLQYTQSCFCYHSLELYTLHRPLLTIFSRHKHAIMRVNTCKPIFRKMHSSYTWSQHSNVEIPKVIEIWIMLSRVLTTVHTHKITLLLCGTPAVVNVHTAFGHPYKIH
jgi:hypothetical protein